VDETAISSLRGIGLSPSDATEVPVQSANFQKADEPEICF
jgi:hypothetical protein